MSIMFLLNQKVSTPLLVKQKELIEVVEADDVNDVVVDADSESVTLLLKQMMLITLLWKDSRSTEIVVDDVNDVEADGELMRLFL
jgi:hypothetical protein